MTEFACVLKTLRDAEVRFVLIGGLASVAHGSAYVTSDVDASATTGAPTTSFAL